jgi:Leucine-rich repeat (LRR) protein
VTGRYSNQLSYHRALEGQIVAHAGGVKRETVGLIATFQQVSLQVIGRSDNLAQNAADQAHDAAIKEIRRVASTGETSLNLSGGAFRALQQIPEELSRLSALERLSLIETDVSDLSPLVGLTTLEVLKLNLTRASNLSPLAGLKELEVLSLNQTAVSGLSPLAGLKALRELHLNLTAVSDLSPLSQLTALQELSLVQTAVTDLSPLTQLTALRLIVLSQTFVSDLAPLARLTGLIEVRLDQTKVCDISPLAGLTSLEGIDLDDSMVVDLRPLLRLKKIRTGAFGGLTFRNTPATAKDSSLARLAEISDNATRGRQTLAYLKTLPPRQGLYAPYARPGVQSEEPKGKLKDLASSFPVLRTSENQIESLLRHAIVTQVTASQLAEQIAYALHELPASDGNQLPPMLQLMSEVGEVLYMMGRAQTDAAKNERNLRLRLAELEMLVERLTEQLKDAKEATKAAEALAKNEGFWASYKKSVGATAGVATVGIVTVGVPTAAIYFLGVENPLVEAFLTTIGKLPK